MNKPICCGRPATLRRWTFGDSWAEYFRCKSCGRKLIPFTYPLAISALALARKQRYDADAERARIEGIEWEATLGAAI